MIRHTKPFFTLTATILFLFASAYAQVLVRDIPAPSVNASSITFDGTNFWVGDNNSNRLIKVGMATGALLDTVLSPVSGSDGLSWDGQFLWTISGVSARRQIFKINPETGVLIDSIPDPAQSNAAGMSIEGQNFWVGKNFPQNNNKLYRIAQSNGAVLDSMNAPGFQIRGVAYDNGHVWTTASNPDADVVYWLNAATGAPEWQFELPEHSSLPDRRIRGVVVVDGFLWIVAYAQTTNMNRILQYDVSNAVQPDIDLVTTPYDFGEAVIGFPLTWELVGSNVGNAPLSLDELFFSFGGTYVVTSPTVFPHIVPGASSFTIAVSFDPQVSGTFNDTLFVVSNDPDEGQLAVPVTGIAFNDEGHISWSPATLGFGEVWVPNPTASSSRTLMVENLGHGELLLDAVEVTSGTQFRAEPLAFPYSLEPMGNVPVRVWFEPTETGHFDGILTIASNDPARPSVSIVLSGSAVQANFEDGESMWTYHDPSDNSDVGINGVTWIDDVNGDGAADVLLASGSGLTVCVNGASSGTADTFWTYNSRRDPTHSGPVYSDRALATMEDITGDGISDVLIGTAGNSRSVYALSGQTGEELWMFDTRFWGDGGWVYDVKGFDDINGDFVADVLASGGSDGGNSGPRRVFALSGDDGELLWSGPAYDAFYSFAPIADVTGDGVDDIVGGTTSWVIGLNGATGAQRWQTSVSNGSPVFDIERMGNANPQTNTSEDVAVASAYLGVYVIDGLNGQQLWLEEFSGTFVYELTILPDISGDDVAEVVVGTVSGRVVCLDGAQGFEIWNQIADPTDPENVLSLTTVPDVTGDGIHDIVCGTLSNKLIVLSGWDGDGYISTFGSGASSAVDAVGILPDVDGSNAFEILMGNRNGWVECISGGTYIVSAMTPVVLPNEFVLNPAYPNPFNPNTTISYSLPTASEVKLTVYDVTGRFIRELVNDRQSAGHYQVNWQGDNSAGLPVTTGVYFVSLQTPVSHLTQKVLLMK